MRKRNHEQTIKEAAPAARPRVTASSAGPAPALAAPKAIPEAQAPPALSQPALPTRAVPYTHPAPNATPAEVKGKGKGDKKNEKSKRTVEPVAARATFDFTDRAFRF